MAILLLFLLCLQVSVGLDEKCSRDIELFQNKLATDDLLSLEEEHWAVKMVDAWGGIPDGLLNMNVQSLGNFYSCYELRAVDVTEPFNGKYCLTMAFPSANDESRFMTPDGDAALPLSGLIRQGLCLPDSCSDDDVSEWMAESMTTNETRYTPYIFGCQAESDSFDLNAWVWIFT